MNKDIYIPRCSKRLLAGLAGLLCWCSTLQGQNYILDYHVDFYFEVDNGDRQFRFHWDYIKYTTESGRTVNIPSNGVLLHLAQNSHTIKSKVTIPANHTTYTRKAVPCPPEPDVPGGIDQSGTKGDGKLTTSTPGLAVVEEPSVDAGSAPECYVNEPTTSYSGPIKKIIFTGLTRDTRNYALGMSAWDDKTCGPSDVEIYNVSKVAHSFNLSISPDIFPCLSFGGNTIKVHYFRMYPDVVISTGTPSLDYREPRSFSATGGFAAAVYQWQYGIGASPESAVWKDFPADYRGKNTFSANAIDIMGAADFRDAYYNKGAHVYVRIDFGSSLYSNMLTLSLTLPAPLNPGSVAATSALKIPNPTWPGVIQSTAAASGGVEALTYQWQKAELTKGSFNASNISTTSNTTMAVVGKEMQLIWQEFFRDKNPPIVFTDIPGATAATYQPGTLTQTTAFRRSVCDRFNDCAQTKEVLYIVYNPLQPGSIGSTQSILAGEKPALLNSKVAASGGNGSYTYTWQQSINGANWEDIPHKLYITDQETFQPDTLHATRYFRRAVASKESDETVTVYSNPICVTVYLPVQVTLTPANRQDVMAGTALLPLTATPSGGDGNYICTWEHSADKEQWTTVGSQQIYEPPVNNVGHAYYRCRTSSFGTSDTTDIAEIRVFPYNKGGIIAADREMVENTIPATIANVMPADGCSDYQWEQSTDGAHWQAIDGATATEYQPPLLTTTTWYRRGALCGSVFEYSDTVKITVYDSLHIEKGRYDLPLQVLAGTQPGALHAVVERGGNGSYTYVWEQRTVDSWQPAVGTNTSASYQPPVLQDTTEYRCVVSSFGMTAYSDVIRVCVYTAFTAGNIGGEQKILLGQTPYSLTGTKATGGICLNYRYQWQDSTAATGAQWNDIDGATGVTYQPDSLKRSAWYRRRVQLYCGEEVLEVAYSNVVQVGVAGDIAGDQQIVMGDNLHILAGIDPIGNSNFTYQWQDSTATSRVDDFTGPWKNIAEATGENYFPAGINTTPGTYYYRRRVRVPGGQTAYSNKVTIVVKAGPSSMDYYATPSDVPINYIVACTPFTAVASTADLTIARQKQASVVSYYDGLGRLIQTVKPLHTPQQKDLVQWATYDAFGRESRQYLPYAKTNNTAGMFVPLAEAQQEQTSFYAEEGAYAFSEIRYEPSPLNRVAANYAPGKAWAAHPATQNYYANTEEVHSWQYVANTWQPLTYRPGTLLVAESKDENGAASKIYKDKLGRQIMTTQAAHATRYVYDKLDRLRAVVPPGVDSPADRERCFFYNYDKRGRTIAQKTPGSGWTYAVYDGRDRKVMGADANQVDKGRWMCYTYDELNRLTRTEEVQLITPYRPDRMQYLYDYTTEMPVTERQLLIETVYDVYPFADSLAFAVNKLVTDRATHNKGRKTMERVRVLHVDPKAAAQYLTAAYYYDDRGRLVQSVADNLMEGTDRVSTAYLFSGAVDRTLQESTWLDSEERIDTLRILTTHTYDALQRPLLTIVAVNDKPPVAVSAMEYDELVRVKTKRLHGEAEAIDYGYNIRGWTARINSNLFTEELFYDQPPGEVAPRYNGDISGIRWRTARQGTRAYAFTYDDLSRLVNSQFAAGSEQWADNYTEKLSYDATGRLQTLQRYAGNNTLIDSLQYTYAGAHLQTINDAATPDGLPQGITNYSYDLNGNVTFEGNTRVAYNLLNLPKQVQLLGGRALRNTYAADGRKLRYEAADTRNPYLEYKTYSGNLVFDKNDNLDYILFDEGRILYNVDDSTFTYEYHLKDHLGSVRVAFTPPPSGAGGPVVLQENTYYPFGAPIKDFAYTPAAASKNPYLREGKEYLATHDWNKYDFTGRTFDPWTAQALQVDPMAEKYYGISPYALWNNNPIRFVDPDGRNPFDLMLLYFELRNWAEDQMGAAQRLATGTSGNIDAPAEADIPQQVRDINKTIGTIQDVATVTQGAVSVAEGVGSIPYADMIFDPVFGLAYTMNGDVGNAVPYALGAVIPGVSGGLVKGGAKIGAKAGINKLPIQIHHFATNKHSVYTKLMEPIAKQFGLNLNGAWNKMPIPHNGRHTNKYHDFVYRNMRRAADESAGDQTKFLELFDQYVKQPVAQNPSILYMK